MHIYYIYYENKLKSKGTDEPLPLGYNLTFPFSPNLLGCGIDFAFENLNLLESPILIRVPVLLLEPFEPLVVGLMV